MLNFSQLHINHRVTTSKPIYFSPSPYFSPVDFSNKMEVIRDQLKETGLVFIKDFFVDKDALSAAKKLGKIAKNIDATVRGVTEISNQRRGNNKKNSAAFTRKGLYPHTDRSPLEIPPSLLMNWSINRRCNGGEALLVDSYQVFADLNANHPDVLRMLSSPDIACFTDGIDTCTSSIFHIDAAGRLHVRFRYDQCVFFRLDASDAIRILMQTIDKFIRVVQFDTGCGYIIANDRWLHGRKAFVGDRIVKRIHIMRTFP